MSTLPQDRNDSATPRSHPPAPIVAGCWSGRSAWRFEPRTATKVLSADSMLAEARLATGLHDFGDDSFREGLHVLLHSCANDARLSPLGLRRLRRHCVDSLITRLRAQDDLDKHPEIAAIAVVRPVFVLGLPFSGATLVTDLLAQDPATRWFRFWELLCPAPSPTADDRNDPRIKVAHQWMADYHELAPAGSALCPAHAEGPDECHRLFQHHFTTLGFATRYSLNEYPRWLETADWRRAYRYYKQLLQILLWKRGGFPIVLQDPFHLWNLDALLDTFPDACIVQLHRDPREVIPAWSRLCAGTQQLSSDHVHPHRIAAQWSARFAEGLDRMAEARSRRGPAAFLDISYGGLMSDPMSTIQQIYAHFGFPLHTPGAERMRTWLATHPRHP